MSGEFKPLRACPFCGTPNEVYSSEVGIVYCDNGGAHPFVSVFTDLWQNAYCWKRIDKLEMKLKNMRELAIYLQEDLTGWTRSEVEPDIDKQAETLASNRAIEEGNKK